MKRFSIFTVIVAIAMIVSACGADAPPTVNPVDVQNTAISAAFTMVAQTQAAIPTATLPPPTETPTQTPMATLTPLPLPTLNVTIAPPTSTPGGDPCANRVLGSGLKGRPTKIRIWNTLKVAVTVSIYLNETASHGECGYRTYNIGKNSDVILTDVVQGCYNLWAWSNDPNGKFNSSGYGCINNSDKWTFEVNTAVIKFVGP
ncbi:MAG: hypothetical protein WCC12_09565 [Anaerolineales bacterium]